MRFLCKYYIIFALACAPLCRASEILFLASSPILSHSLFFRSLWKALAERGHQMTVLTAHPSNITHKNVREIDMGYVYDWFQDKRTKLDTEKPDLLNWFSGLDKMLLLLNNVAELELECQEVQELLNNKTKHFDLVIAEMHVRVMFGFAHRFKCPLLGISSTEIFWEQHQLLGNPTHPLMYPEVFAKPNTGWNFLDRLFTLYYRVMFEYFQDNHKQIEDEILRKYFGGDVPSVDNLIRDMSYVFLNVHPLFNARPLGSKFITIGGGSHIEKRKNLPEDLSSFLNGSPQGVVYMSLGTYVRQYQYPPDWINITLNALKQLPYRIIWKIDQHIPDVPSNVKVVKWVPQQDLLRHQHIKVFVCQGGVHSTEEAMIAGVPMIVIPFMSDQFINARHVVDSGMGLEIDKDKMTAEGLVKVVQELVNNPRYKESAMRLSELLLHQPLSGLEKVVWYSEHAIRYHKGLKAISPAAASANIPFYQYYFLDCIVTVLLGLLIITFCALKVFKGIFQLAKTAVHVKRAKVD